jgi:hypothetical protein
VALLHIASAGNMYNSYAQTPYSPYGQTQYSAYGQTPYSSGSYGQTPYSSYAQMYPTYQTNPQYNSYEFDQNKLPSCYSILCGGTLTLASPIIPDDEYNTTTLLFNGQPVGTLLYFCGENPGVEKRESSTWGGDFVYCYVLQATLNCSTGTQLPLLSVDLLGDSLLTDLNLVTEEEGSPISTQIPTEENSDSIVGTSCTTPPEVLITPISFNNSWPWVSQFNFTISLYSNCPQCTPAPSYYQYPSTYSYQNNYNQPQSNYQSGYPSPYQSTYQSAYQPQSTYQSAYQPQSDYQSAYPSPYQSTYQPQSYQSAYQPQSDYQSAYPSPYQSTYQPQSDYQSGYQSPFLMGY